jgi:hypothetical protein
MRHVRAIETADLGILSPAGLAYSPAANVFFVSDDLKPGQAAGGPAEIVMFTPLEDPAGRIHVAAGFTDPLNLAFDARIGRLVLFDETAGDPVMALVTSHNGQTAAGQAVARLNARTLGVTRAQGMTFDPAAGRLFVLDAAVPRVVGRAYTGDLFEIDLRHLAHAQFGGIAFNSANGHLYILDRASQTLYELSTGGTVLATRNLASLRLHNPQGLTFAPSGDPTDDPAMMNLYVADGAGGRGPAARGRVVEVEITPPTLAALPAASTEASLVRMIDTSQWRPPSPDPSGITYLPASGRLLISDGEVEEMSIFEGYNIFESTQAGSVVNTYSSLGFSDEPTDVAIDPASGHLFFSDDNKKKIYEVALGADGALGTGDDLVSSFSTQAFNCVDPEGLAFGAGKLFVADGLGREIYIVAPGSNGRFDGVAPTGDDEVTHFDTNRIDQPDPEGVGYNADRGTLFIVSNYRRTSVVETTLSGKVVQTIDIAFLNATSPAGLVYAPSSLNPALKSLYIVARGIDNDKVPNENDGKIYEIKIDDDPPTPTATPTPIATQTPKPTQPPPAWRQYLPLIRQ